MRRSQSIWRVFAAIILLLALAGAPARAQGCAACRDTTAGSAPRAREGLRRAIAVLGAPAAGLFLAVLALAYRLDTRDETGPPPVEEPPPRIGRG